MESDSGVKESVLGMVKSLCYPEINLVRLTTMTGGK